MTRTVILLGLSMAMLAADVNAQATRTVRLSVADDVGIIATYYPVEAKSAAGS